MKASMNRMSLLKELEEGGLIGQQSGGYYQTSNNCIQIACFLAEKFGYFAPSSPEELRQVIDRIKRERLWGQKQKSDSIAYFIVYEPDYISGLVSQVHVVFEIFDGEYNFGAGKKQGFEVTLRLPLERKKTNSFSNFH